MVADVNVNLEVNTQVHCFFLILIDIGISKFILNSYSS